MIPDLPGPAAALVALLFAAQFDSRVDRLGDVRWTVREKATRELIAGGAASRPAVRMAFYRQDPEIRARAKLIWDKIKPRVRAIWVAGTDEDDNWIAWTVATMNDNYPGVTHEVIDFAGSGFAPGTLIVYQEKTKIFEGAVWKLYADDHYCRTIMDVLYPD